MNESARSQRIHEIIQTYIELGNTIRLSALPNWVTADLNVSQLKAIVLLEHYDTLTISELARLLDLGNSATSILVQQLVEQEVVERSEDVKDRRRTYVRVTARGARLIAGRREQIRVDLSRWLSQMDEPSLAKLQQGLDALVGIMQAEKAAERQAAAQALGQEQP